MQTVLAWHHHHLHSLRSSAVSAVFCQHRHLLTASHCCVLSWRHAKTRNKMSCCLSDVSIFCQHTPLNFAPTTLKMRYLCVLFLLAVSVLLLVLLLCPRTKTGTKNNADLFTRIKLLFFFDTVGFVTRSTAIITCCGSIPRNKVLWFVGAGFLSMHFYPTNSFRVCIWSDSQRHLSSVFVILYSLAHRCYLTSWCWDWPVM